MNREARAHSGPCWSNYTNTETIELHGKTCEQVTCGCPTAKPDHIPHTLVTQSIDNNLSVHEAAAYVEGRPKSSVRSLKTAAAALKANNQIDAVPQDWQP